MLSLDNCVYLAMQASCTYMQRPTRTPRQILAAQSNGQILQAVERKQAAIQAVPQTAQKPYKVICNGQSGKCAGICAANLV